MSKLEEDLESKKKLPGQLKDDITKIEESKARLLKCNNDLELKMKDQKF